MHICILETGAPPEPLKSQFGDYPFMFRRLLAPDAGDFSFSSSAVFNGAPLPALADFDGLIITGSPAGVYEGHVWIAPAEDLVRRAAAAARPVVGVCFGHQLMTQAFGGKVEKSEKGWGVGVHVYDVIGKAEWMEPTQSRVACMAFHQDQVVTPPGGAKTMASSDFCPFSVLEYAQGPAISFQSHPEFAIDYGEGLMRLRRDRIPEARLKEGLQSLGGHCDHGLMARWIDAFFRQHAGKR